MIRGISFTSREAMYVIRFGLAESRVACFRVPSHRRMIHWEQLLHESEMNHKLGNPGMGDLLVLLAPRNEVLRVLAKLEPLASGPSALVHAFFHLKRVLVELPRFGMQFEVVHDQEYCCPNSRRPAVGCLNYRGYVLDTNQKLHNPIALPESTRYLVLKPVVDNEETKVIVPKGEVIVREKKEPLVWIHCPDEDKISASLATYCYTVHPRWKVLRASNISARLQLASMFAATGTLLHDPSVRMCGSEMAMEFVRRCFVNHPLEEGAPEHIFNILSLSGLNPSLAILCKDLVRSSKELDFLYASSERPGSLTTRG